MATLYNPELTHQQLGAVKDLFEKLDKNKDGTLQMSEWASYMKTEYGFTDAEAEKAWTAWDLDRNGAIDPNEFEGMMGHVTKLKMEAQEKQAKAVQAVMTGAFGGNEADMEKKVGNMQTLYCIGCCCCACTLCLSWCPLFCKMRSISKQAEAPMAEANVAADLAAVAVKNKLLDGPKAESMGRA